MSEAIIAKKAAIVDEVSEKFTAAASVVVVDYRGLTVDEVTRLRKQLRDANVEMKVIKNSQFFHVQLKKLALKAWTKYSLDLQLLHSVTKM